MIRLLFILAFAVFQCPAQQLKFTEMGPYYFGAAKLYGIAYGGGKFVAVGENITLMSSDNGQTWHRGRNVPPMAFYGVVWAGTKFVAVGDGNKTIYSVDGLNWNVSTLPKSYALTGIAWDSQTGIFITSGPLLASGDGMNWNEVRDNFGQNFRVSGVAAGQGKFLAASGGVAFSQNGPPTSWSSPFPTWYDPNCTNFAAPFPGCMRLNDTDGATLAGGAFYVVTVYRNGAGTQYPIYSSSEGQTWSKTTYNFVEFRKPCALNDSLFFPSIVFCDRVAGTNSTLAGISLYSPVIKVGTSTNSQDWKAAPVPPQERISALAVTGPLSVGVGGGTNAGVREGRIVVSTNPLGWNTLVAAPSGTDALNAVRNANGAFIAVGKSGTVIRSTDALTWTKRVSNTFYDLNDVAFGNGQWVVVGAAGRALTSVDGTAFSLHFASTELDLMGVTFGGGQFVAVGKGGALATSTNGADWTGVGTEAVDLYGIAYGLGKYVAVGTNGVTMTSPTGSIWTKGQIPGAKSVTRVAFANGYFVANESGTTNVYASTDGIAWQTETVGSAALFGVDATDGEIWVSGDNTATWRTSQGAAWAPTISAVRQGTTTVAFTVTAPVVGDYEIQFSTSLPAASWQTATVLTGIEGTGSWVKNDAVDKGAFYRVVRR